MSRRYKLVIVGSVVICLVGVTFRVPSAIVQAQGIATAPEPITTAIGAPTSIIEPALSPTDAMPSPTQELAVTVEPTLEPEPTPATTAAASASPIVVDPSAPAPTAVVTPTPTAEPGTPPALPTGTAEPSMTPTVSATPALTVTSEPDTPAPTLTTVPAGPTATVTLMPTFPVTETLSATPAPTTTEVLATATVTLTATLPPVLMMTPTITLTVTPTAGPLSVTGAYVPAFPALQLSGTEQTLSVPLSDVTVEDLRGTGAGWRVQVAASQLAEVDPQTGEYLPGGKTLPRGSLQIAPLEIVSPGAVSPGPALMPGPAILDDGAPVVVARAAVGAGMGRFTFGPTVLTLSVPPDAYARPYRTDVTVSIISGP